MLGKNRLFLIRNVQKEDAKKCKTNFISSSCIDTRPWLLAARFDTVLLCPCVGKESLRLPRCRNTILLGAMVDQELITPTIDYDDIIFPTLDYGYDFNYYNLQS